MGSAAIWSGRSLPKNFLSRAASAAESKATMTEAGIQCMRPSAR